MSHEIAKRNLKTADPPAPRRVEKGQQRNNCIFSRLVLRFRRPSKSGRTSRTTIKKEDGNKPDETDDDNSLSSSSVGTIEKRVRPLDADQSDAQETSRLDTNAYAHDNIPDNTIHSCLKLLSSNDLDRNRVGLQRLVLLTKGRTLSGLYRSEQIASHVLVFGGSSGSVEERLQYVFSTMICDVPHEEEAGCHLTTARISMDEKEALFDWILDYEPKTGMDGNGKHTSYYDDDSSCSSCFLDGVGAEYEPLHPQGKARGALHNHALRILSNALEWVASSTRGESLSEMEKNGLQSTLWRSIIHSLVGNIETNRNTDATGYSLRILRLLYTIHPETIDSLVKYAMIDLLLFFTEYGKKIRFSMIYSEASYLLRKAGYNSELW
eukprot:jgi/Psemu1/8135/gm1.8135_g